MAEQHSQTADYVNRWKFTGHELDRETGLYYAGARYYDPRTSIFLSVDMLAEQAPSWTPYRYGFNNPVRYTDPTGMFETEGEAKQWAKDNNIKTGWFRKHKVSENSDGTWSINNKKDGVSYSRDPEYSNRADGVTESVYIEGKSSSSGSSFWSWFTNRRSGSTFWGTQRSDMSGGGAKRGANGEIYGSWDYNEMLIPSGGGANIPVWLHKSMELKTNIPNIAQRYVASYSAGVGLGGIFENQNSAPTTIMAHPTFYFSYELSPPYKIDTLRSTVIFNGTQEQNSNSLDSLRKKENRRLMDHPGWIKHLDSLKKANR